MTKVFPSLEVHWGGTEGARDLVVGYLEFDGQEWSFQYADGLEGVDRLGFEGFQGLPRQAADAKSPSLFPAFSARIPTLRRADVVRACGDLTSLPREEAFYEFLRRSGGRTGTDQIWFTEVTRKAGRESEGLGKAVRNEIRKMVAAIRDLLNEDIRIQLEGTFRILRDGQILNADAVDLEKRHDREAIESAIRYEIAAGRTPKEAVEHFTREVGFTCLNRLAALKMMEARGLIQESVSRGRESSGFRLFRRVCEEVCSSQPDGGYRRYLELLFDDAAVELRVLFDRTLPHSRIFPRPDTLSRALNLLNESCPAEVWKSDETIGWIYQYFTPKEDREALRDPKQGGSQAPRSSYELAVRNQFYTPRYVVEFLSDNTLGRTWHEMRKGQTQLLHVCQYLVRRPNETFLAPGETPPPAPTGSEISQEELLRQASVVPHRLMKDPRDIRILDPACGSGHFLLYAFDLLLVIYEEAWADPAAPAFTETGRSLRDDYRDLGVLRRELPGLVLRHNLHGIDIDLRATQIAAFALWLRAQRAYQDLGIKASERPRIRRSNIVCAESLPGNLALLDEFLGGLQPPVLRQLVRVIFDKMALAGEAGSLLKIEEEIADTVAEAKRQWASGTKAEQMLLWPEAKRPKPEQGILFDTAGITEEAFWHDAEERVLEELRRYSRHAEVGQGVARYLFAEDAAQGFAFVDLCRRRFDVVLMNPPFGQAATPSQSYIRNAYRHTKYDMYAASIERSVDLLVENGGLGAITNRTGFFLSDFTEFRERLLLKDLSLRLVADLGDGVLDGAMVSTAAYCSWRRPTKPSTLSFWFRLVDIDANEKGNELQSLIMALVGDLGTLQGSEAFICRNDQFRLIRTSPLAYWVPEALRHRIASAPEFEPSWGIARTGLQSLGADDQFIRAFWEVPTYQLSPGGRWVPFAKGGLCRSWYYSPYLVTDWEDDGRRQKRFAIEKYGTVTRKITGMGLFFHPGITYTTYTILGFHARVLPAECVFSLAGSGIFTTSIPPVKALGYLNSTFVEFFLSMTTDGRKWDPGYIKRIPVPPAEVNITEAASQAISRTRRLSESDETTREFVGVAGLLGNGPMSIRDIAAIQASEAEDQVTQVARLKTSIDDAVFQAFGFSDVDVALVNKEVRRGVVEADADLETEEESEGEDVVLLKGPASTAVQIVSFAVGSVFGRWDVRIALDQSLVPKLSDAFDRLPTCSPATLVGTKSLPATAQGVVSDEWLRARATVNTLPSDGMVERPVIRDDEYPLPNLPWDGILVDDEGHPSDIVSRIREAFRVLWGDRAEGIELEICEILETKDLRSYIRNPKRFFEVHIKRYSRGRRKAPLYWLLQSSKRSYGVWLYYHRLTRDTLFHLLRNYIEPKIEHEQARRHELRRRYEAAKQSRAGAEERRLAKDVDAQETLVGELVEFKATIEAVAYGRMQRAEQSCPGWDPDLNDGVILNIAPLHAVVPWKEAAKAWDELAAGGYEWSHVALRFWPKRVEAKCREDRSIALAHGQEVD